ncbi:MAG: hypothetical protein KJ007_13240 [Burkholderiales bacterium]|nr:hypothetical protein [Burkholderiales bacterium]
MKRRALLQQDLAHALGISSAMVSRLKRRGMPTSSVAAAIEWRRRNLDPAQLHEAAVRRGRTNPAGRAAPRVEPVDNGDQALAQIVLLAAAAAAGFERWGERLREAMAALPRARWGDVRLPPALWEQLLGPYAVEVLDAERAVAGEHATARREDDPDDFVGDVVYGLAAGLYRLLPPVHMSTLPDDGQAGHG